MRKQLFSIHLSCYPELVHPLIYPLKSPVFIGGSGDEWLKSTPSSSFNYARYKRGAAYQIG